MFQLKDINENKVTNSVNLKLNRNRISIGYNFLKFRFL